jgi:hypothetical protein
MHGGTAHDCDDGGELPTHSVDTAGSKLGLVQRTVRVIEPSCCGFDEHVSEQAPHSPIWYEYVTTHGRNPSHLCVTSGLSRWHPVSVGSTEPADDTQVFARVRVGAEPPKTHVAEQPLHGPNS